LVQCGIIDDQVADLVGCLRLPDDGRERLQELAEHRVERLLLLILEARIAAQAKAAGGEKRAQAV
jgi:hypothetical protein